jgi:RHS repeat-associated protein
VAVDGEDVNGVVASGFHDDPLGRPTQVILANNISGLRQQKTISYDDDDRIVTVTSDLNTFDDNKLKSETVYDGLGRVTESRTYESGGGSVKTKQFYDGLGRVIKATNPYRTTSDSTYGETHTTYDFLGRVTKVKTSSDNAEALLAYSGNEITVTDQAGKQRKRMTDALGRLTTVFEAPNVTGFNYETRYQYDALNNLTKVVQGPQNGVNDQIREFVYDGLSRLKLANNPESGTLSYDEYDGNGNLKKKTDARGVITNYTYDVLDRQMKRSYNDGTPEVNYFYDAQTLPTGAPALARGASIGQLLAVTYGGATSINGNYTGYDAIGRANKSAQVTNGQAFPVMEYGYNLAGHMTWQKYPSGREVTTQYDDAGRFSTVTGQLAAQSRTYVSLPEYGAHGALTALKLGNGLWEKTSYNRRLQPTEIKLGSESNPESVLKLAYSYGTSDNNGNPKSQVITVPTIGTATGFTATQNYEYDPLNRLQSAQELGAGGAQSWKQTFSYDRFGNRRFNYQSAATTVPTEPTTSQQIAITNPEINAANNRLVGYSYDAAGNVTTDASGRAFSYDAENHQITYNGGALITNNDSASYFYDGDSRRVKKQLGGSMISTIFIYNISGQLVAEYTDSPETRTTQTNYLTTDTLGSTRVVTSQNQTPNERYDYLPFGEEIGARWGRTTNQMFGVDGVKRRFTGQIHDGESSLDYFNARYYSSALGRFTSADLPFADQSPDDPQSWNLFVYSRNNPLRYTDPSGRDILENFSNWINGYGWQSNAQVQAEEDQRRAELSAMSEGSTTPGVLQVVNQGTQRAIPIECLDRDQVWAFSNKLRAGDYREVTGEEARRLVDVPIVPGGTDNTKPEYRQPKSNLSGREGSKNIPSWAKGERPLKGENGDAYARRLLDRQYGDGKYSTKSQSEYSKLKKFADRNFEK